MTNISYRKITNKQWKGFANYAFSAMINLIDHYIPDLRPFSSIFFVISKRDRLAKKKKKNNNNEKIIEYEGFHLSWFSYNCKAALES